MSYIKPTYRLIVQECVCVWELLNWAQCGARCMRHAAALSLRSAALWSGSAACAGGVELVSHSDGAIGLLSPPLPLLPSTASMPLFMRTEGHIMEPRGVGYPALRPYRSQVVGEQACRWKESIITQKTKTTLSLPPLPPPQPQHQITIFGGKARKQAQLRSRRWKFFFLSWETERLSQFALPHHKSPVIGRELRLIWCRLAEACRDRKWQCGSHSPTLGEMWGTIHTPTEASGTQTVCFLCLYVSTCLSRSWAVCPRVSVCLSVVSHCAVFTRPGRSIVVWFVGQMVGSLRELNIWR